MKQLGLILLCALPLVGTQNVARPRITGVAHISVFAHDYEACRRFYGEFLGFEEPYSLKNANGSPSMTFFKINDRQYIELAPEKQPGSDRLNHYALETDDAEGMRVYLASRGVRVPDHVPTGRIGNLNFMIKDPEGHDVEIVQYGKSSWTVQNFGKHLPETRISPRMTHVGIIVTKLDAEMSFYTDILGFRETWRGSKTGNVLSWINLRVPDGSDYLEFMLYKEAPAPEKRGTAHHLCLATPDVAATLNELNTRAYRKSYNRPLEIHTGVNRKRQLNVFDPDGTRLELMEPRTVDGMPAPSSTAPPPAGP
jgi:catechol 2,3-dioxygenase-like lactoylglutathione lyase family enzyme